MMTALTVIRPLSLNLKSLHMPEVNKVSRPVTLPKPKEPTNSEPSIFDRVQPIKFAMDDGLKVLLYGASGTGKTTFWATFPGPILAMICSGGVKSGELRSINTPEYQKKVHQIQLRKSDEIFELMDGAYSRGFKTIVLDHVSGLTDMLYRETCELAGIAISNQIQKQFLGKRSQEVYGKIAADGKEIAAAMLNHSCNIIIVGQERSFGGKDDGFDPDIVKPSIGVATTPALAQWLAPACDYVLQTFKRPKIRVDQVTMIEGQPPQDVVVRLKGVEYCLRCEPHDTYQTKFRIPKGREIPDAIVDPTYAKLMKVISG